MVRIKAFIELQLRVFCGCLFFTGVSTPIHSQSSPGLRSPEFYFANGQEMITKANFAQAKMSFQNFWLLAEQDARLPLAEYYMANSGLNLYNLDSEQSFANFAENHPAHPKALRANYDLGNFYFQDKNYKKSIVYLSKVDYVQLTAAEGAEARFRLAYSYFSSKEFDNALTQFNQLKRQTHQYAYPSSYYAAFIEFQKEDYEKALNDLSKAQLSDAYKGRVPYIIANIYYRQEQYDLLINYGEKILDSNLKLTNKRDIYLLMGEAHYFQEDYQNAKEYYSEYRRLFKGTPTEPVVLRMAIADFNLGNNDDAINNLKLIASKRNAHGAAAAFYLGWLYQRQNNLEFAAAAFRLGADQKFDENIAEESSFQYAKISVDLGRSVEAINRLEVFQNRFTSSEYETEINDLLATAYVNSNNLDLAIKHMESLGEMTASSKRKYQEATLRKGNEFFNQRKYREARDMYDKSLGFPVNRELVNQAKYWRSETLSIGRLYREAIPGYLEVINSGNPEMRNRAEYGVGYCFFNEKNYQNALGYFRSFIKGYSGDKSSLTLLDGRLRLADCYFATKDYPSALNLYSEVSRINSRERPYAFLQMGIIQGISGEILSAKDNLNRVVRNYSRSPYVDDAFFEIASLDYERGNYQSSITGFSQLIEIKPNSPFVPYAYQRRAIAHFNEQNFGRTEEDYKKFLDLFPAHKEANNVLLGLQEVLALTNKSGEFEDYFTAFKEANPEAEGLQYVEFESAKTLYNNQNYDKAIANFEAFIQSYPQDHSSYEAKYYIAESYYRKNENYNALPIYYEVLTENQVTQITRVIQRIADLEYAERNYRKSILYYKRLEDNAYTQRHLFNAWTGKMKAFHQLSRYDSATFYAAKILSEGPPNPGIENGATLYQGKVAFARGDYERAVNYFNQTINRAKDVSAAEAQYLIGEVLHQQQKFVESNEVLFLMPSNFSVFEEWLGKAFLLISENYISMNEYIQARATLNSIIDNTQSGIIANLAKAKLNRLDELEGELNSVPGDSVGVDTLQIKNQ